MCKRYVKEFINDRKKELERDGVEIAYKNFCLFSDKIISLCERGLITNVEAARTIGNVDFWELCHKEELSKRINGGY